MLAKPNTCRFSRQHGGRLKVEEAAGVLVEHLALGLLGEVPALLDYVLDALRGRKTRA
jgi:hypothetical protein